MRFGGLIAAIVFAAIAAIIVLRMSAEDAPPPTMQSSGPTQVSPLKTTNIFVAAVPIPIGSSISQEMVAIQPWPEHLVLDGFIKADGGFAGVVGMVARTPFQPQEPIIGTKLANANDPNFIAGMLPKGMRVVTIQINETEGVAGFVFPGDRVDVMFTHDVEKYVNEPGPNGAPQPPRKVRDSVTESLLNNVKVIAVDQRATGAVATDQNGRTIIPRTVSLMVSPSDAQRVRLAAQKGTLTLQLRSLADRDSVDPLTITTTKEISQFPAPEDTLSASDNSSVTVVRGTNSASTPVGSNTIVAPVVSPAPTSTTTAPKL